MFIGARRVNRYCVLGENFVRVCGQESARLDTCENKMPSIVGQCSAGAKEKEENQDSQRAVRHVRCVDAIP
ncbi:hypothetical protein [Trueperella sp. LYQ143]|uniref:hypothetical protein n=1 Tax=Trueperella sp. LYQ143 TaxID=3391059 RepID=UPI003982F099